MNTVLIGSWLMRRYSIKDLVCQMEMMDQEDIILKVAVDIEEEVEERCEAEEEISWRDLDERELRVINRRSSLLKRYHKVCGSCLNFF
jgi:hypothetical protein